MKMLKQVQGVNEQLEAYRKKYIVGETLTDRVFGGIRKRFEEGAYAHIRTEAERLPEVFRNDSDSDYMQKAQQVWQETRKASSLPHPSQTFTVTKNGVETDYEIPDEEWDDYTRIYRDEYSLYLSRKGTRWDTMTLIEQQNLLKNAHSAANKAMREALSRTRVRDKKIPKKL